MDIFNAAQGLMVMSDRVWAKHAHPWSGWTRLWGAIPTFFALWSPYWIGWWSVPVIAGMILWTLINPRLFPPPKSATAWMTKGVLGERVFLNRKLVPIPKGHERAGQITTMLSGLFVLSAIYGFIIRDFWLAFAGWHAAAICKIWFVDRMAWLWEKMKDAHPVYQAWAQADWTASFSKENPIPED